MDIAVVIPAYNRPEMLLRAVESVLSQTTPPKEFVVVDDGSGVNLSVVHARVEAAGHRFLSGPNSGVAHARNRGIHATKSDWIAFLDSDDYWLPEKLACQSQYWPTIQTCASHSVKKFGTAMGYGSIRVRHTSCAVAISFFTPLRFVP